MMADRENNIRVREVVENFIAASGLSGIFEVRESEDALVVSDGEKDYGLADGMVEMLANSDGVAKLYVYKQLGADSIEALAGIFHAEGREAEAVAIEEELEYAEFVVETGSCLGGPDR